MQACTAVTAMGEITGVGSGVGVDASKHTCVYVCMYVCMYVCVCIIHQYKFLLTVIAYMFAIHMNIH